MVKFLLILWVVLILIGFGFDTVMMQITHGDFNIQHTKALVIIIFAVAFIPKYLEYLGIIKNKAVRKFVNAINVPRIKRRGKKK